MSAYLHSCPAQIITNSSLPSNLSSSGLASWAFRPVPANGAWDYAGALANATKEGVFRADAPPIELSNGAKAGIAVAAILLVVGGLVALFKWILPGIKCVTGGRADSSFTELNTATPPSCRCRRSRARRRGDEDFEVNDAGYKSWYGPPSSGGKAGWRGSVAGYFAGASLANASGGGGSSSVGRRGQSPGGGSMAAAGAWNEMKEDPSASGGKEYNDVYPLSGSAAPFAGQSANPFIDPNQVSRPEGLDNPYPASYPRHHEDRQQQDDRSPSQRQQDDQLDDIYGSYDEHDEYDPDANGPAVDHAADGWEEREGESDFDRQKRWEDEGRAGGGGHARDQSFGGGGEHGDGMVGRSSSRAGSTSIADLLFLFDGSVSGRNVISFPDYDFLCFLDRRRACWSPAKCHTSAAAHRALPSRRRMILAAGRRRFASLPCRHRLARTLRSCTLPFGRHPVCPLILLPSRARPRFAPSPQRFMSPLVLLTGADGINIDESTVFRSSNAIARAGRNEIVREGGQAQRAAAARARPEKDEGSSGGLMVADGTRWSAGQATLVAGPESDSPFRDVGMTKRSSPLGLRPRESDELPAAGAESDELALSRPAERRAVKAEGRVG